MTTIFRKTAKGTDEIATRANRLVPRLRTALILVDGVRDDAELAQLIKERAAETLKELQAQGYVEIASVTEPAPKKAAEEVPARKAGGAEAAGAGSEKAFAAFRSEAVRALNELTGPAGDTLAIKMEKATSREQLAPLLQTAYQIISSGRGVQAANEFKARFASF